MPAAFINHPQLGNIRSETPNGTVWVTKPLLMGAFGYLAPIETWTEGGEPTSQQIAAMISIHQATPEFREMVAGAMREKYMNSERPAYLRQIGDPRYVQRLTESDLPELSEPSEMWKL